ncbi:MAG: NifU family protein, partial [Actinobacteria bacterium]|nr:NifU family protein [Actinomycetota bacterium]
PTTCVRREDLQAIIDRAAGPLLRLHGGTVTVTDVAPDRVTIAMSGACSGCGGVTSTVQGVIAPAVHAGYPELEVIVAPEAPTPAPRVIDVKKPGGLLGRGRGGGSCH